MRLTVSPFVFPVWPSSACLLRSNAAALDTSAPTPPLFPLSAYGLSPHLLPRDHTPPHRLSRCPFCKRFKPVIGCVADALKGDPEVAFYRFEGPSHEDMKDRFAVSSYPTLRFFPKGFILDASYFGKGAICFGTRRSESNKRE